MKFGRVAVVLSALAAVACSSDHVVAPVGAHAIVGSWTSAGSDVAPGLAVSSKTARVVAVFNADNTYSITVTDSANAQSTSSGTWVATGEPGKLGAIELSQTFPSVQQLQGVVQINGARMAYEVVQVVPVSSYNAPTIAGGLGSTTQNGAERGSEWIQRFILSSGAAPNVCNPGEGSVASGKVSCEWSGWDPSDSKR